jgi:cysteine desulfurase
VPKPIYMDHHATTPVLPEVVQAMMPFFSEEFGNPSSTTHVFGKGSADAVERARKQVADFLGAAPSEIVFTSGATESNNLAIRGAFRLRRQGSNQIITSAIEHEAVLETCKALEKEGCEVVVLPVDGDGLVDPQKLVSSITDRTFLISIQAANNEIGSIQPLVQLTAGARERGVLFHSDAAQAAGRIPLAMNELGLDMASISGHKMYGPKGVGALYVRRRTRLEAQLTGGGHEKNRRSGTLNVPGIVGLGKAAEIAAADLAPEMLRQRSLRDRLWRGIQERVEQVKLNGHPEIRLANNLNVSFRHVEGEALLVALRDVAALSTGSACHSGAIQGSPVLMALGVASEDAHSSVRFGLGRMNTEADVDLVAERIAAATIELRKLSPFYEPDGTSDSPGQVEARSE